MPAGGIRLRQSSGSSSIRALAEFIALDRLEPELREFDHLAAAHERPAHRFAELLGLPAYEWLSPHLVQDDAQYFLGLGGREVGTKPSGS
jgi:hypothetical protein